MESSIFFRQVSITKLLPLSKSLPHNPNEHDDRDMPKTAVFLSLFSFHWRLFITCAYKYYQYLLGSSKIIPAPLYSTRYTIRVLSAPFVSFGICVGNQGRRYRRSRNTHARRTRHRSSNTTISGHERSHVIDGADPSWGR